MATKGYYALFDMNVCILEHYEKLRIAHRISGFVSINIITATFVHCFYESLNLLTISLVDIRYIFVKKTVMCFEDIYNTLPPM